MLCSFHTLCHGSRSESRLALCGMSQDDPPRWGLCTPATLQTACVRRLALELARGTCTQTELEGVPDVLLDAIMAAASPPPPGCTKACMLEDAVHAEVSPPLFVCTLCKGVHAALDATTNPAHYRYLELARRRHYAPVRRGQRGGNVVGTVRAALGLTAAFVVGRLMRTASERRSSQ